MSKESSNGDAATTVKGLLVTVFDVAPSDLTLSAPTVQERQTTTLTGSFHDPGSADTHTVLIDWGDPE